jgi:hypothetical protein
LQACLKRDLAEDGITERRRCATKVEADKHANDGRRCQDPTDDHGGPQQIPALEDLSRLLDGNGNGKGLNPVDWRVNRFANDM